MSSIEANLIKKHVTGFNLNTTLNNLFTQFTIKTSERNISLNLKTELIDDHAVIQTDNTRLIAGIGLFGLTLFVIKTQTKEIGIKKVFGSSEKSIVISYLLRNFMFALMAAALSIPATLYFMTNWLKNYPYKVPIDWLIFAISFIVATIVVLMTVSIHSYKASRINPVEALRYV